MSIFIEKEEKTLLSKKYRPNWFQIAFKSLKNWQLVLHDVITTADICRRPCTTSNPKGKTKIESLKDFCENVANSPVNNMIYSFHNVQNDWWVSFKAQICDCVELEYEWPLTISIPARRSNELEEFWTLEFWLKPLAICLEWGVLLFYSASFLIVTFWREETDPNSRFFSIYVFRSLPFLLKLHCRLQCDVVLSILVGRYPKRDKK